MNSCQTFIITMLTSSHDCLFVTLFYNNIRTRPGPKNFSFCLTCVLILYVTLTGLLQFDPVGFCLVAMLHDCYLYPLS